MKIRSFEEKDRENCREICLKTATDPQYVKSKELVCLLYCDYYLDNEPDNCFVLADDEDNAKALPVAVRFVTSTYQSDIEGEEVSDMSEIKEDE